MKKKIGELQKGDLVQLFTRLIPVPYPYEVTLIEMRSGEKTIDGLRLESPSGDKKNFSFLDKEKELTIWSGYDVGSSHTTCNCCGSEIP